MAVKITIGVPVPALNVRTAPRPYTEVAENCADAAKRLNAYVNENKRIMKGPRGGFTEHQIIRAIQNVQKLPVIKQQFTSGPRTRTITLEYTDAKPSAPAIAVYF